VVIHGDMADADLARAARARDRLAQNAIDVIEFADANLPALTTGFGEVSHAPNQAYKAQLAALVENVLVDSDESEGQRHRLLRELQLALNSITYISFEDLSRACAENVALLQTSREPRYCLMVPSVQNAQKSNMWFTLLAAAALRPMYAASVSCYKDIHALNAMGEKVHGLFFDDCVYSGTQMSVNLKNAKDECPTQEFYCVPAFWHQNERMTPAAIHPLVRAAVEARSKGLKRAQEYFTDSIWNVHEAQTLTFLQTKQPDSLSFPEFLWNTAVSPFVSPALTALYNARLGALSIADNCTGKVSCPPALYKDRLRSLLPAKVVARVECLTDALQREAALGGGSSKRRRKSKSRTRPRRTIKSCARTRSTRRRSARRHR
jgi:hypothetical protein